VTIQNVLLPTDFSDTADQALAKAIDVAEHFGATLHLFHVIDHLDPSWYGITNVQEETIRLRDQIRNEAEALLEEMASSEPSLSLSTEIALEFSFNVPSTVMEYAGANDIDLIVMGTHGRGGFGRFMLGSVANKLVRRAPSPVLTVNPSASDDAPPEDPATTGVLAPIDFSKYARTALRAAKTFAHTYDVPLHLLFVAEKRTVPTFRDTGIPGVGVVGMDDDIIENATPALDDLNQDVGGPTVTARYHVRHGAAAHAIVDVAQEQDLNLIVMATRGLSGLDRWMLGSTTERVVRTSTCPVLTLRAETEEEANQ
jgi:nucleotide-binding universal stress UspA family protein